MRGICTRGSLGAHFVTLVYGTTVREYIVRQVFEIVSPSDSLASLRRKMRAYLADGARLAVLVDPDRRAVEIFASGREPQVVEPARSIAFDPVLPWLRSRPRAHILVAASAIPAGRRA